MSRSRSTGSARGGSISFLSASTILPRRLGSVCRGLTAILSISRSCLWSVWLSLIPASASRRHHLRRLGSRPWSNGKPSADMSERMDRNMTSLSSSIRSACGLARTTSSVLRRSKISCRRELCAVSRLYIRQKVWRGLKACRGRRACFFNRRKWKQSLSCRITPRACLFRRKARHRVAKADGPERYSWRMVDQRRRDRAGARLLPGRDADGTRYWLFRDGPTEQGGSWWLHGVGDA